MIQAILASAGALVAGVLLGGCAGKNGDVTDTLLQRNAQPENQINTLADIITAMAVTVVLLGCGLGASAFGHMRRRKEGQLGRKRRKMAKDGQPCDVRTVVSVFSGLRAL